jgi:hypothetical protein
MCFRCNYYTKKVSSVFTFYVEATLIIALQKKYPQMLDSVVNERTSKLLIKFYLLTCVNI